MTWMNDVAFRPWRNGRSGASSRSQKQAFRNPGSHRDAISVVCAMEQKDLDSAKSFRRFIADEDPLFHKGFLERIFDRDPEGLPKRARDIRSRTV